MFDDRELTAAYDQGDGDIALASDILDTTLRRRASAMRVIAVGMLERGQVELLLNDLVERARPLNALVGLRQWNHLGLIQVVGVVSGHGALQ
jgi:hypothetical protein